MTEFKCQEASHLSKGTYIPCGRPAPHSVRSDKDDRSYNMCEFCMQHAVSNRGLKMDGAATADNPDIEYSALDALKQMNEAPAAEPVYDYSDFAETPKSEGELGTLAQLAEQARAAEYAVEEAQRTLKKAQELHRGLVEIQIPELMERVGMEKFSTTDGLTITVKETIRASLGTGPQKEANLNWLEEQGHEAIIKQTVAVPFGRGDAERAKAGELAKKLRDEGFDAAFERKVEPSTLSALIRELLEEGRAVPEESFGLFRQRVAKVSA